MSEVCVGQGFGSRGVEVVSTRLSWFSACTWDAHGIRDCRALQKASPKAAAFYTFGRGVILHFAAPLLLQIALGSVDLDAVGGGFAAANRIEIYRSKSNL